MKKLLKIPASLVYGALILAFRVSFIVAMYLLMAVSVAWWVQDVRMHGLF